jgi:hypothetical protein
MPQKSSFSITRRRKRKKEKRKKRKRRNRWRSIYTNPSTMLTFGRNSIRSIPKPHGLRSALLNILLQTTNGLIE